VLRRRGLPSGKQRLASYRVTSTTAKMR
jgi:hypothetical protein